MKKLLLSLVLLNFILIVYAQTDTLSTNVYQENGRLGIGVSSPEYPLDITDSISSGVERNFIKLQNKYNGFLAYTGIRLITGDGSTNSLIQDYGVNYTASPNYDFAGFLSLANNSRGIMLHANSSEGVIKFYTGHDAAAGAGIERMRIAENGNVGIGTSTPEFRLQLVDNNNKISIGTHPNYNGCVINLRNNYSFSAPMLSLGVAQNDYSSGSATLAKANWAMIYGNSVNEGIAIIPDQNQGFPYGMFIDKNANVGIGTDNPQTQLQIERPFGSPNGATLYVKYGNVGSHFSQNASGGVLHLYSSDSVSQTILRSYGDSYINATFGNVGIGNTSPSEKLDINGGLRIGNTDSLNSGTIRFTGSDFEGYDGTSWKSLTSNNSSLWQQNGNNIFYQNGNVGIGTSTPAYTLDIQKNISSGAERNLIKLQNEYDGSTAYTGIRLITGDGSTNSVIQDYGVNYTASPNYDFAGFLNVANNSRGIMLHANSSEGVIKFYTGHDAAAGAGIERMRIAANGNVGIGTSSPTNALTIVGDETEWPGRVFLSINNTNTGNKSLAYMELKAGSSGNHLVLGHISETYTANAQPEDLQDYSLVSSNGNGLILNATKNDLSPGVIKFFNGQNSDNSFIETMRIDEKGKVGIGTSEPQAKLQVADGDIYISDINRGIIMKSPDGNCWRGVLNDDGQLVFSKIDSNNVATSIKETGSPNNQSAGISIFPNPTDGNVYIDAENFAGNQPLQYELIGMDGKTVQKSTLTSQLAKINLSAEQTGTYIIRISTSTGEIIKTEKIIKN